MLSWHKSGSNTSSNSTPYSNLVSLQSIFSEYVLYLVYMLTLDRIPFFYFYFSVTIKSLPSRWRDKCYTVFHNRGTNVIYTLKIKKSGSSLPLLSCYLFQVFFFAPQSLYIHIKSSFRLLYTFTVTFLSHRCKTTLYVYLKVSVHLLSRVSH